MIRMLIFILSVILVAGAVTYFASMEGRIDATAFGNRYDIHAGGAMALVFVVFVLIVFFTSWFKDLSALPSKLRAREKEARRTRGVAALTRGLEAVAVGDASDAQHHARVAQRNLDDGALTRLLTAQAAEIAGDEKTAGENFTAMLEAPETEFLGLRGLYTTAMRQGDKATAQQYAERAFKLRNNAQWAFESVFDLGLDRGAWGETRAALATAVKNKIIDSAKAKRAEAALLSADAYAAALSEDTALALEEAEAALKIAPGFAPAATLAAKLHQDKNKTGRAARILEQAFAEEPQASVAQAHRSLFENLEADKRAEHLKKLADRQPAAREAKLNFAYRHILLGEHEKAIAILEPLLMEKATAREAAAMAEAVAGAHGPEAATIWLEKAASAPRDPSPGADGNFHFTRDGWARLVREYMVHGRLAPPPLEDAPRGLTLDEIKVLAPPPAPEPTAQTSEPSEDAPTEADLASATDVQETAAPETVSEKPVEDADQEIVEDGNEPSSDTDETAETVEPHDSDEHEIERKVS